MTESEAKSLIESLKTNNFFATSNHLNKKDEIKSILKFGDETEETEALVTIIIPAYRRPDLFERAFKSALFQEGNINYEILITDDSEELATEYESIVRRYNDNRVRYYKNEKALGWYNWNRLLELARTPWVCMLHDDDILNCKHIFYMSELLKKCNHPSMLTCKRVFFKNDEAKLIINDSSIDNVQIDELKLKDVNFQFASFMLGAFINREKAIDIGGFNDGLIALDFEFIARMLVNGRVFESPIQSYGYGVKNNESTKSDMWEKMLINEYFICRCIAKQRGIFSGLALKVEDYSIAQHIYDMGHPSRNIYGVEIDPCRLCEWLGIDYNMKNKGKYRFIRKMFLS